MPIYDQSYHHWSGHLKPNPKTWFIIARNGIRMLWRRWMIILVIFASIPFLIRTTQIYLITGLGFELTNLGKAAQELEINTKFFLNYLHDQNFFIILIVMLSGSSIIARDKQFNALQLYFSKPVSQIDYIMGKLGTIGFYISLVSLLPALILFLIKIMLEENFNFLTQNYWIPFSIIGYWLMVTLVFGGLILALSALGRGSRFAGIVFFTVVVMTDIFKTIFSHFMAYGAVSISSAFRQIGDAMFAQQPTQESSGWLSLVLLVFIVLISYLTLKVKVKGTEVVQ